MTSSSGLFSTDVILGSRSPQRLALLRKIVEPDRITACPPRDSDEAGFVGLDSLDLFASRLDEIVSKKADDVVGQLDDTTDAMVICADTTIVGYSTDGQLQALGQPPEADWQNVVRGWFRDYLSDRPHDVLSGVRMIRFRQGEITASEFRVCRTTVTIRNDADEWLDWYVATGEPVGKAGGYAIQGAGSVLVSRVEGSISNVIGLPLEDTVAMLRALTRS